jgi:RNA polymerase sigma factor (sigma-70 family)
MEPTRTQWQVRCTFNAFCKRVLKNEAINIYKERRQQQSKEMTFLDLTPQEESQLYTLDKHYEGEEIQSFQVAGTKITLKSLAEAMRTLPKEKHITVLLYYFLNKSDVEIGQLLDIPRSTVQYRRTSSFEQLKRFWRNSLMTGTIDSNTENIKRGLLPYPIILAANKGDPEAMKIVVLHYGSYMTSLSMRKLHVESVVLMSRVDR